MRICQTSRLLNLVPTIKEEYVKLGSFSLIGLPEPLYPVRYVKEGTLDIKFPIVAAGRNKARGAS